MKAGMTILLLLLLSILVTAQPEPIVYWKMNEGDNDKITDSIEGLEADIDGPNWGNGYIEYGLVSNGYDNRISADDEDYLDLTTNGAIAVWVKLHSYLPFAGIIHKGEKKNWRDEAYTLQFWNTGKTLKGAIVNEDEESLEIDGETELEKNVWYYVIFTWDQNFLRLYLDGELEAQIINTVGAARETNGNLQIASQLRQKYNKSYEYFGLDGAIDEVAIFDEFISVDEALVLYQGYTGSPPPEPGIQANWGFAEGSGGTAADSVNNLVAQLEGASWDNGGVNGSCVSFDGDDDFLSIENTAALNPSTDMTISLWLRWDIEPSTGKTYANLISKNGENQYQIQHNNNNSKFEFAVETVDGRKWIQSLTGPQYNKWYHVVGTYSSSREEMSIFVNGVKEKTRSQEGKILPGDEPLLIGKHGEFPRHFQGSIDEVKIYNKVLSDEEIESEFHTYQPDDDPPEEEIVIQFKLDEGEGESIYDVQRQYEGSIENSAEWIAGHAGTALKFNGDDQWVSFSGSEDFEIPDEFTLVAWVNASENKTAKILQKGDWDGHSLGMDKWNGWQGTISIGDEAYTIEWQHGRPILGEWYLLVITYDGSQILFYVNGELQGTKDISGTPKQNTRPFALASDNGSQKFFNGKIDEFTFLGFSVTEEEIDGYYESFHQKDDVWEVMEVSGFDSFPYSFDINSEGVIFSGNWGGAGVFRSSDQGINWDNLTSGYWVWTVAIDDDDNVFVGTSSHGVIRSTDNGENWDSLDIGNASKDVRDIAIREDAIYISSWGGGVLKSTDDGETWTNISATLASNVIHSIAFDSQNRIWAGAYDGLGVFYSDDDGNTWNAVDIPYKFIWSIDVSPEDELFVGTFGGPDDVGLGLYISNDFGSNWNYVEEFRDLNIYGVQFVDQQTFVMTWENGMYTTGDMGDEGVPDYLPHNAGLMSGEVSASIPLPDGNIIIATSDSYLYRSVSEVTSVRENNRIIVTPDNFTLEQNYPNPFNPSTKIRFTVSETGNYKLTVYNLIGEQVTSLLDSQLSSGLYEINFKADNLPSGIYYYTLEGMGNVSTRKMILLK
ncbi:MAG: hypothetical protein SCALA702_09210 [Melioribacteraceae bacterium]|nr:MAG: hypothetical protein SCALA702_09210 [Melioribacteraceae bacterium]